ncbi:hypothetical protein HMPREF0541_02655 [Lacticaseibacillus rhamnosus ATCC 21052]|nr:hypothetical protein HMPREF0541_02655 [Lacticaseibacillus rhamnosus ATCC 21052]
MRVRVLAAMATYTLALKTCWFTPITRSPAQKPACKDLGRNGQTRPLMFWFTPITRSPAQESACKDLGRNGQSPGHHV